MKTQLSIWRGACPPAMPTMAQIAAEVAEEHGISVADLKCESRKRKIAHPRQEAYARCLATGLYTTTQVARFFGGRDHSTICWGAAAHAQRARA